jgi:hypothetical protein
MGRRPRFWTWAEERVAALGDRMGSKNCFREMGPAMPRQHRIEAADIAGPIHLRDRRVRGKKVEFMRAYY